MARNGDPKKPEHRSDDPESHIDTLALINGELVSRLARQEDAGGKVETKATVVAGFAATAVQLLIARHPVHPAIAIAAAAAYAAAIASTVTSIRISSYKDIAPRILLDEYGFAGKGFTLASLAATRVVAFEHNELIHKRKARWWWIGLWALLAGVLLSVLSLVQTGKHAEAASQNRSVSARLSNSGPKSRAGAGSIGVGAPDVDRAIQAVEAPGRHEALAHAR